MYQTIVNTVICAALVVIMYQLMVNRELIGIILFLMEDM